MRRRPLLRGCQTQPETLRNVWERKAGERAFSTRLSIELYVYIY